ncbi:antirestriction protein ArdA [Myxococcota bacterium]
MASAANTTRQNTNKTANQGGSAARGGGDEPRVYAACLASYAAGILHGRWISADQEPEDIQAEIHQMLAESPEPGAEEWAFHDNQSLPGLGEFEAVETVAKMGRLVTEHGYDLVAGVMGHLGDVDEVELALSEHYQGEWKSLSDWACDWFEQTGELQSLPESLAPYFDYDAWARDAELNGDVLVVDAGGSVHILWSR